MNKISVFITDNDNLLINSLVNLFKEFEEITFVGRANSGAACIERLKGKLPDVILMDIRMEHSRAGIEAAKKIIEIKKDKAPKIIFLTVSDKHEDVADAITMGLPYINKSIGIQQLVDCIKKVYRGEKPFVHVPNGIKGKSNTSKKKEIIASLTPRELQVMCMIGQGDDRVEIAQKLKLHITTVHLYRKNIKNKLPDFNIKNDVKISQLVEKYNLCDEVKMPK